MGQIKSSGIIIAMGYDNKGRVANPLTMMGATTVVKRMVVTYQQAGISPIIVVTGFDGLDVERHLAMYEVIFYRTDSKSQPDFKRDIMPALEYAATKGDNIVISSVEHPFFEISTIKSLIEKNNMLSVPTYKGTCGYPIVMSREILSLFREDFDSDDWVECIANCNVEPEYCELDDNGIIVGINERDKCTKIIPDHDKQLFHPYVKLDIDYPTKVFDSRMKMLLLLIDDNNAVKTACARTAISIGKAWEMINVLENALGFTVVKRKQGGSKGGTTELTFEGREYLRKYQLLEDRIRKYADEEFKKIFIDE